MVLIAIPIAIVIKVKLTKSIKKIDVTSNAPLCLNPSINRRAFTNGYWMGIVKKQLPRKNGTTLIEFYAFDVEQGEFVPRPDVQSMVVKNEFIKRFPKGELSSYRETIIFVGRTSADYPERMRETDLGKWMTVEGQKAWLVATFGKMIQSGDEAISEAMKDYARGQMTKNSLAQIREENAEFRKLQILKEQETGKPGEK